MIAFYVTGHGYGHATRAAALAAALKARRPGLELELRTNAPAWIFTEACPGLVVSAGGADAGLVQKDALDIDLEASLRAQEQLDARWPALVEQEAAWLRARRARLVVGDIPPLAFAAAARAGIPSIGVSNFTWDWIFEPYAAGDARWERPRRRCADAYAQAERAYRIPLHGDFPAFRAVEDAPLLCRLSRGDAAAWRASRGVDGRPLALLAFGGFGVEVRFSGEDLSAFWLAGFGPKPAGLRAPWLELRGGTSADQLDAMGACDVVVSKPGYGIVSEALGHGKRMLYVPREGFREIGPLVAGLTARGAAAAFSRADFEAGRWRAALEGLLGEPEPAAIAADGGDWIARRLLERLDTGPS